MSPPYHDPIGPRRNKWRYRRSLPPPRLVPYVLPYLPTFLILCPRHIYVWATSKFVTQLSRDSTTDRSWTDGRLICLRGKTAVTSLSVCMVPILRRPTYACAHDRVPSSRDRATEYTSKSVRELDISLQKATTATAQYTTLCAHVAHPEPLCVQIKNSEISGKSFQFDPV
eukprot:4335417-Pleurochrysis_carterae.AAC.1